MVDVDYTGGGWQRHVYQILATLVNRPITIIKENSVSILGEDSNSKLGHCCGLNSVLQKLLSTWNHRT